MATGIQSKTGARSIEQARRRAEMLRMRVEGSTVDEIADHMGVVPSTVKRVISNALTAMVKGPAEELRALELARVEELLAQAMETVRAFHPLIANGKVVYVPVLDDNGETVCDPATGEVLTCLLYTSPSPRD